MVLNAITKRLLAITVSVSALAACQEHPSETILEVGDASLDHAPGGCWGYAEGNFTNVAAFQGTVYLQTCTSAGYSPRGPAWYHVETSVFGDGKQQHFTTSSYDEGVPMWVARELEGCNNPGGEWRAYSTHITQTDYNSAPSPDSIAPDWNPWGNSPATIRYWSSQDTSICS